MHTREQLEQLKLAELRAIAKEKGIDLPTVGLSKPAAVALILGEPPPAPPARGSGQEPPAEGDTAKDGRKGKAPKSLAELVGMFLTAIPLAVAKVKQRGTDELADSKDRRYFHSLGNGDGVVCVEELNFHARSGYDDNFRLNALEAAKRCLNYNFGGRDAKTQSLTYDALPPFDQRNRVVVMVAILPPAETSDQE
jgi:hypothetical protein